MADPAIAKESQAHELVHQKEWQAALQLFDQLLNAAPSTNPLASPKHPNKERTIACLIGRTECLLELNQYEQLVVDCRRLLKLLNEAELSATCRARRCLIHGLYKLKRYSDAEAACVEWTTTMSGQTTFGDMFKVLDRYRTLVQMANGQKSNQRISLQRLDEEMLSLDSKLDNWITQNLALDSIGRNTNTKTGGTPGCKLSNDDCSTVKSSTEKITVSGENNFHKQIEQISLSNGDASTAGDASATICCTYCAMQFADRTELRAHCQTEQHQKVIMSDEGQLLFGCK